MDGTSTDLGLPSPKRARIAKEPTDIKNQIATLSPDTQTPEDDDDDDLYGPSFQKAPSPPDNYRIPYLQSDTQPHSKQRNPPLQLPGLTPGTCEGCSTPDHGGGDSAHVKVEDLSLENGGTAQHIKAQEEAGAPCKELGPNSSYNADILKPSTQGPHQCELSIKEIILAHGTLETTSHSAQSLPGEEPSNNVNLSNDPQPPAVDQNDEETLKECDTQPVSTLTTLPPHIISNSWPNTSIAEVVTPQTSAPIREIDNAVAEMHGGDARTASEAPLQFKSQDSLKSSIKSDHSPYETGSIAKPMKKEEDVGEPAQMDLEAEFEIDSSPIESSSDSASDSSSSDDSDDYQMLDPEEQARRLMQEDGGSDGEGAQDAGASKTPLRTLNEKPDEVVPKPNITITADMKIQELGDVENLVENLILIKAKTSGEYQVLETGSVLCLGDRSVIGVVAETLGRVQQPYYSVRFTNAAGIAEAGISKGTNIFFSELHSTTVFTQPLKAYKGSDASNIHDEEVADDEIEFSDDEAEAEYKRRHKQEKQARREGRSADPDGIGRGPGSRGGTRGRGRGRGDRRGGRSNNHHTIHTSDNISYDDMDTDEPYVPLARPMNLHELMNGMAAPLESPNAPPDPPREKFDPRARTDGSDRARGDNGGGNRSRGDRGRRGAQRGRGGHPQNDYNSHLRNPNSYSQPQYAPTPMNIGSSYYSHTAYQPPSQYGYGQQLAGYPSAPNIPETYDSHPIKAESQSHYSDQYSSPQSSVPSIPPGAFINPAFFAQAYQGQFFQQNPFPMQQSAQNSALPSPNPSSNGPASPGSNAGFLAAQDRLRVLQDLARSAGRR